MKRRLTPPCGSEDQTDCTGATYLKFPYHKGRILFRNFNWKSGTRINKFTSARSFPKSVKGACLKM
jgi:hypothetical protein